MSERPEGARAPGEPPAAVPGATSAPDPSPWDVLARWRGAGRTFVMITVTECRGSTPREPGARMLLAADGETAGTIGGGTIEHQALARARELLHSGGTATLKFHLTQELGMCCGGEMTLFLELVSLGPRVYVFGAGYVAKPFAALAGRCGFQVTVVDERPDWLTAERFPGARLELREPVSFAREATIAADDYAVVMTHDHALDQRLVQELLRRPLRFLGMLGSVAKQRKFALRLKARGFGDGDIARLHTPLGIAIGAEGPEEIAVSVMAQLVAARRGLPVEPGWVPPARAGRPEPHATANGGTEPVVPAPNAEAEAS